MNMFYHINQGKNFKNLCVKVSKLIITGKLRFYQLVSIDPAEIIVPFTSDEFKKYMGRQ